MKKIVEQVRAGQAVVLTHRARPALRLEPIRPATVEANDPVYRLGELAKRRGTSLTNHQIDNIVYGLGESSPRRRGFSAGRKGRLLLLAKLFELGLVSSGKAAEACGMTRMEFLLSVGKLGVSLSQLDSDELKRELADA
jgi:antitoxin (DNA-binding transcriptional repressor) of toxin-antitoxin stability system